MSDEIFKMQWFVDAYKNNELNYMIASTGKKKGTVVLPTGAGKSGVVYSDIVHHINNAKDDEKIIFNISAPILKLEAQLLNDFFSCVKKIFPERVANGEFMFFINSSADGNAYEEVTNLNTDANKFYGIKEFNEFKTSEKAKFAIVASCHKSLYKFAEKIDELNSYAKVITYLDEAHLVVNETRDDKSKDELSNDGKVRWESMKEICKGECVYALTATPDKYITKLINEYAGEEPDYHIIDVPARELIKENKILPVLTELAKVSSGDSEKITKELCAKFMDRVINLNPNIHHKILVTCSSTEHLTKLRDELSAANYKVFSTCAREGGLSNDESGEATPIDEVDFIEEIDSYEGNCFVLHIKQLIQGIDIKSLTDCIIYNSTTLRDGVKRTLLQTIGRTLRPLAGERGMPIEMRKKKNGNVLILIAEENFDEIRSAYFSFLQKYYGNDGIKAFTRDIDSTKPGHGHRMFDNGSSGFGNDYFDVREIEINRLMVEIEKFVKEKVYPRWKAIKKVCERTDSTYIEKSYIDNELNRLKKIFSKYGDGKEYDTCDLLDDTSLMKGISDVFKKVELDDVED